MLGLLVLPPLSNQACSSALLDASDGPTLPVGNTLRNLLNLACNGVYVREWYRKCANYVLSTPSDQSTIIYGTPGVGKSVSLIYLLYRCVKAGWHVLLSSTGRYGAMKHFHISANGRVIFTEQLNEDEVVGLGSKDTDFPSKYVHLVDIAAADAGRSFPLMNETRLVRSMSPGTVKNGRVVKRQTDYFCIPPFDLTELKAANSQLGLGINEDVMMKGYDSLGGVARFLLCPSFNPSDCRAQLEESLEKISDDDIQSWLKHLGGDFPSSFIPASGNTLIHISTEGLRKIHRFTYCFASRMAQALFFVRLKSIPDSIETLLQCQKPSIQSFVGSIFENYVQ